MGILGLYFVQITRLVFLLLPSVFGLHRISLGILFGAAVPEDVLVHSLAENIHLSRSKLPSANPLFEEKIQLSEGPPCGFRNTEIGINNAKCADTSL